MSAIGDNVAGEATVTRSGRVVKLTEKAQEMQAAKPKQSSRAPVSEKHSSTTAGSRQTSSEKARDELARANELSIKLQYIER